MADEYVGWPAWFYGPNGEAEIFHGPGQAPADWRPYPFPAKTETIDVADETGDNTPKRRGRPPKQVEVTEDEF